MRPSRSPPLPQGPAIAPQGLTALPLLAALATGGLLSLMVLCNGTVAAHAGPFAASLAAHGTGTVAAGAVLLLMSRGRLAGGTAPAWAYLGGLSGAVTVTLSSFTANGALALSGTLALGLLGQVAFGLAADAFGLFGLPQRRPTWRDAGVLSLILAGSGVLLLGAAP